MFSQKNLPPSILNIILHKTRGITGKLFVIPTLCFQEKPLYSHHLEAWLVSVLLLKCGLSLVDNILYCHTLYWFCSQVNDFWVLLSVYWCCASVQQHPGKYSLARFILILAQQAAVVPLVVYNSYLQNLKVLMLDLFLLWCKSTRSLRLVTPQMGQKPYMQTYQNAQDFLELFRYLVIFFSLCCMNLVISSREMVMHSREIIMLVLNLHHLH